MLNVLYLYKTCLFFTRFWWNHDYYNFTNFHQNQMKNKKVRRMCIHHYSERKPLLIHFLDFCLQISQQLEVEYHRCTQGWWRSLCLPNIIISTKDFGDISQCQRLKISDFSYFFTYLLINIKSLLIAFFSFLYYFSWFGSITTIRSSE